MASLMNIIIFVVFCYYVNGNTTTSNETIPVLKTHIEQNIRHNGFCDITRNCTDNKVCVDNLCRCKPNHKWNDRIHRCVSYNCMSEAECIRSDPNRECVDEYPFGRIIGSKCNCKYGYNEDQFNYKCRKFCFHNYECDENQLSSETNHMTCVDYLCQCKPNFKWNTTSSKCEYFECKIDSECWGNGDNNRECDAGVCVCNFNEDLKSKKCYLSFLSLFRLKNYHSRKETLLICTIFIIPAVLGCCLHSAYRKRKRAAVTGSTVNFVTKDQLNGGFNYPTKQ